MIRVSPSSWVELGGSRREEERGPASPLPAILNLLEPQKAGAYLEVWS